MTTTRTIVLLLAALAAAAPGSRADGAEGKPEVSFEFAQKPSVERAGDRVTIRFETRDYCDVTVAVEESSAGARRRPRIVRHLASGLLGPNAPAPFRKNSRRQTLVWDGKDDQGAYVDDKDALAVRVSLGLRARFERALFWHPMKRVGLFRNPFICAQPEGVYVYEGAGVEMVRLYGHDGSYLRTVYPFPSSVVRQVEGIEWRTGRDGSRYPQKKGYWRSTFLQSGRHGSSARNHAWGSAGTCFTVRAGRAAVVEQRVDRFATSGAWRGVPMPGPRVWISGPRGRRKILPHSAALGPDGRTLYLAGFFVNLRPLGGPIQIPNILWRHGVYRMDVRKDDRPELWKGTDDRPGKDKAHFNIPAAVACDATGRVYVADHYNDRVQVFSADGELLRSIPVPGPSQVQIHHKTGEIFVFSWRLPWPRKQYKAVKAMLRTFAPLPDATPSAEVPLPLKEHPTDSKWWFRDEDVYRAALDSWTDPPTVWLVPAPMGAAWRIAGGEHGRGPLTHAGVRLFALRDGKLERTRDFHEEVERAVLRIAPPIFQRQRLYVDPRDGTLYLAEGNTGTGKSFGRLLEIDPRAARCREIPLPMAAEDLAIDANGLAYLRLDGDRQNVIARFQLGSWREVPFDYGEERGKDYFEDSRTKLVSALIVPGWRPVYWHQSGMDVTPGGELAVHCYNRLENLTDRRQGGRPREYSPRLYPGRYYYGAVHVWDRHGQIKHRDAFPGLPDGHGTRIDLNGDLYVLVACHRLIDGREPFGKNAGTIIKAGPGRARLVSSKNCKVPIGPATRPEGPPQLGARTTGPVWAEGVEWTHSGVGVVRPSAPCQCWNTRFDVDYLGRTFAPETDRCQVAVLDTNGNLVLRVGRYGNVDEGVPLIAGGHHGPGRPVPLGGDETGLVYPVYVATHTDRRLFVADPGNGRIAGIRLTYHAEVRVPLKGVADGP
ncbi:MAG: hypothetical protein R6V58_16265 [Planctomycetota bacterium]